MSGANVLRLNNAAVDLRKSAGGYQASLDVSGGFHASQANAPSFHAVIAARDIVLSLGPAAASATVHYTAPQMTVMGAQAHDTDVNIALRNLTGARADMRGTIATNLAPESVEPLLVALPPSLAHPLAAATRTLKLDIDATITRAANSIMVRLNAPAVVTGDAGASLRVGSLNMRGAPDSGVGTIDAVLDGPKLPYLSLASTRFGWSGTHMEADGTLTARLSYDRFRGVDLTASGNAEIDKGIFRVVLAHCAPLRLAAYQAGRAPLATNIGGTICPMSGEPIVVTGNGDWRVAGTTPGLAATVPAAGAHITNAKGRVTLFAHEGALPSGEVQLERAEVSDATGKRFKPLSIAGPATLDAGHIRAHMNVVQGHVAIGTVDVTHAIDTSAGTATIHVPHLVFAPEGLQPLSLSPLLSAVTRVKGNASFEGALAWTARGTTSHGRLVLDQLDLRTPLGMAHGVTSTITLSSLLPLATAPSQHIQVTRVDWTMPLSGVDATFALAGNRVQIAALRTNVASGTVTLDPFALDLTGAHGIAVTAHLTSIDLAELVAVSNLGKDVALVGRISGTVPVASTADGIRIANGHIRADGPGRLMIKRTLWTKGDTTPVNAVQDFAYQALENLAYDSMTADLNSIANGRLGIVFHIKGRNDPPTLQEARINLFDLINGTAFTKPIPLPSNTPIDLTLDSTLNFDELLRSYSAVWTT
ncbi:MAG TPA: YdbH domain-containing protein, partial [Rhizomicrobium sp.]|nr:YdbH domain-containing protein [Rhizomicrobium sp.]